MINQQTIEVVFLAAIVIAVIWSIRDLWKSTDSGEIEYFDRNN